MNIFELISKRIQRRPVQLIILVLLICFIMLAGLPSIRLATGNDTLISTNSQVYQDNQKLESEFGGQSIVVLYQGKDYRSMLIPSNIEKMKQIQNDLEGYDGVFSVISPIKILEQVEQKLFREMNSSHGTKPSGEYSSDMLQHVLYTNDRELRKPFQSVMVDGKNMLMVIKLDGNIDESVKSHLISVIKKDVKSNALADVQTIVTGKPILDANLQAEMKKSMQKMIIFAVIFMIIVLAIVFKVRWRLLALPIIFIGVMATLGFMGWMGIPMTMVSMAVFPILIGLGVDYAIQFHNRYEEEQEHALRHTMRVMGPAVGTAIVATLLGFIALFISPVPMIQDFGKMLTIGIAFSFLIVIFMMIPMLFLRDRTESKLLNKSVSISPSKEGRFERGLGRFADRVMKLKYWILVVAVVMTVLGIWADQYTRVQTDVEKFMPQNTRALQDIHTLRSVIGSTDQITILYEEKNGLTSSTVQRVDRLTNQLKQEYPGMIVSVQSITSVIRDENHGNLPPQSKFDTIVKQMTSSISKLMINQQRTMGTIVVSVKHVEAQEMKKFISQLKSNLQQGQTELRFTVTGKSVIDVEMLSALTSGRNKMTLLGMLLVFLGLLVLYRHPIKALLPLLPISMIVGWSGGIMYMLGLSYTPLTATLGALIIGIGTEFSILLMERFYEERRKGRDARDSMMIAASRIGKAVIASGLTVIGGFSALLASNFAILKDFGFMTVINMVLALISTLVIMPSLLVLFDRFVKQKQDDSLDLNGGKQIAGQDGANC